MTRDIRHGASRPDPHEIRVSRVNRKVAGRFGRVRRCSKSPGSGWVWSRGFQNLAGQVGSGRDISKISRAGSGQSGQVTRPDPTRPVRFDLTSEKPWKFGEAATAHLSGVVSLFRQQKVFCGHLRAHSYLAHPLTRYPFFYQQRGNPQHVTASDVAPAPATA